MLSKRKLVLVNFFIHLLLSGVLFVVVWFFVFPSQFLLLNAVIALNLSALVLFGYDKLVSGTEDIMRLPELFFYLIAALGASAGIFFGALLFRHKTLKPSFMLVIGIIVLVHLSIVVLMRQ